MTDEEYGMEEPFRNTLDIENLLLRHMNRMAIYRDTDLRRYCSSIETFILICPGKIRGKAFEKLKEIGLIRGRYTSISEDKLVQYDNLYIFINEQLEKNKMIWKSRSVKVFE